MGEQVRIINKIDKRRCCLEFSIQHHNQKVIEEAPSPFLDEKVRAAMGEQVRIIDKID
jgi:acetyl/propionyl-CoA carboxylase alpha subunit